MCFNKRGSTLVEAALVFPMIILIIMGLLVYAGKISEKVSDQADRHIRQREQLMEKGVAIKRGEADLIRMTEFGIDLTGRVSR